MAAVMIGVGPHKGRASPGCETVCHTPGLPGPDCPGSGYAQVGRPADLGGPGLQPVASARRSGLSAR